MSETFDLAEGDPRSHLVEELRRRVGRWEASAPEDEMTFSTGTPALDRLLGGASKPSPLGIEQSEGALLFGDSPPTQLSSGGRANNPLRYGMLVEWLNGLAYNGAATLSLLCAREACRLGGALVVIDRLQTFYPPAAAAWGIDLDRLIIVRPRGMRDALWAAVQGLRSPAVAAVWAPLDRLNSREFRQLQLAAQVGRTLGLLLRPSHVRGQPSWADVQLEVRPLSAVRRPLHSNHRPRTTDHGRNAKIQVLRQRGTRPGGAMVLEIDDANHTVKESSQLSAIDYRPNLIAQNQPKTDSRKPKANSQQPQHHESLPLFMASELADPAVRSFPARA
jgi:hypothetical protein